MFTHRRIWRNIPGGVHEEANHPGRADVTEHRCCGLRQRRLPLWDKNSREALAVRGRYQSAPTDSYDPHGIAKASAEVAANTLICLINQATYPVSYTHLTLPTIYPV